MLIGRQKEIQKLIDFFNTIQDESPSQARFILLEGEAGSGKSYLIDRFIENIKKISAQENYSILIAQAYCDNRGGSSISYLPFFQILENLRAQKYKGTLAKIDNFGDMLSEVAPSWLKLIPVVGTALAETATGLDEFRQERKSKTSFAPSEHRDADIYYQYLKIIENISAKSSLILVLDDIQWIDQESANLLSYLTQHLPQSRRHIMLLSAHRPYEEIADAKQLEHPLYSILLRLKQKKLCETISLSGLSQQDFDFFINNKYQLSSDNSLEKFPKDFRSKIYSMTNGNPLFFTEFLKNMEEKGEIIQKGDEWFLELNQQQMDDLPNTLEAALEERIFRLEDRLKDLLQIGSIEGDNFTAQVSSKIQATELPLILKLLEEQLSRKYKLINEAEEKEIAFQKYISIYAFRHGLIREYLYKRLSNSQRRILHQQVADCLEEIYGNNSHAIASQLARHYLISGDHIKTAKYGVVTAQLELQKYAPRQTIWWCKVVHDAISAFPANLRDDQSIIEATILRVEAEYQLGNNDVALSELYDLENTTDLSGTPFYLGKLYYWKGELNTRKGDLDSALENLREANEIFLGEKAFEWKALCLRRTGHIYAIQGYFTEASKFWEIAIQDAKKANNQEIEAIIWSEIAEFAIDEGNLKKSDSANHAALEIFQRTKSRFGEGICLRNMGFAEYVRGQLATSDAFLRRSAEIFHELDDTLHYVWSSNNLVNCLIEKDDYSSASQILNIILPLCIEMNEVGFLPELYICLTKIYLQDNKREEALATIEKAAAIVLDGDGYSWPRVHYTMGNVLMALGKQNEAEYCLKSAISKAKDSGYKFVLGLAYYNYAIFLHKAHNNEAALLLLDEVAEIFNELEATKRFEDIVELKKKIRDAAN